MNLFRLVLKFHCHLNKSSEMAAALELHRLNKRSRETDDSEDENCVSSTQRDVGEFAKSAPRKNSSGSEADSDASSVPPSKVSQDRRKANRPICPVLGLPEGWNLKVVNEARTQVRIRVNIRVYFI